MAVKQSNKVRPILNLSAPINRSLNDAAVPAKIPKIFMSTAKDFSFSILEAGYGAKMSKHDLCNAYKIIPSHPSAWRLHGFSWLSKYFVDTTSIFGSKSAPAHFDCLGFVLALLAATICKIPKKLYIERLMTPPLFPLPTLIFAKNFHWPTGEFANI